MLNQQRRSGSSTDVSHQQHHCQLHRSTGPASGLILLNRRINSETAAECEEIIYVFPADTVANQELIFRLRGVFITCASVLQDSLATNFSDIITTDKNFFFVQLMTPIGAMIVGVLDISPDHLFVLALPSNLLPGNEVTMEEVCHSLVEFLTFFIGDLLEAVNSLLLAEMVDKFFQLHDCDWPKKFTLPPQRAPLCLEDEAVLQDALLPLEAEIGILAEKEDEGKHRRRQAVLIGCALLSQGRLLIGHLPFSLLDQLCRLCYLYQLGCLENDQLTVRWYPILSTSSLAVHKAFLILEEGNLVLGMALSSRQSLQEPPFSYVAAGKTRLTELKSLYSNKTHLSDPLVVANPHDFFELPSTKLVEKDESKYNLQWLKSQMSPQSLRKTSSLSGSSPMLAVNEKGIPLTTGGKLTFSFIYLNRDRIGLCALPREWNISLHQTTLLNLLRNAFQTCFEGMQWLDDGPIEQSISITVDKAAISKSNKEGNGQLTLVIAGRREKCGEEVFICYHAGCPQNLKQILERFARQTVVSLGPCQ